MNQDLRLDLLMKTICFNPGCSVTDLKKILHGTIGPNEVIDAVHILESKKDIEIDKSGLSVNKKPKWKIYVKDRRTLENIQDLQKGIMGYQKEIDLMLKVFKREGLVKNILTDYFDDKGKKRRHKSKTLNPKIESLLKIVGFYFDNLFLASASLSSNLALGHISKNYNSQVRKLEKNVIDFILENKARIENIQFKKTGPKDTHTLNQLFRLNHQWLIPIMEKLPGDNLLIKSSPV